MRHVVHPAGLAAALLGLCAAADAAILSYTFDGGPEGWTALACDNPGFCAVSESALALDWVEPGGNPGGYIETTDPSGDEAGRVVAPAALLAALAPGLTLTLDALVKSNGGGGAFDTGGLGLAPLVTIESGSATLVYAIEEADFPVKDGPWESYTVPLASGLSGMTGWYVFAGADPSGIGPASDPQIAAVVAGATRLTLISEWLNDVGEFDSGGIDNVNLVPVPPALPLFGAAAVALLGGGRQRARRVPGVGSSGDA